VPSCLSTPGIREPVMTTQPSQPFHIRSMQPSDKLAIIDLSRSLTSFFPDDLIPIISAGLDKEPVLVGELGADIVGFLVYTVRDPQTAEIIWFGVKEEYHGLGLGSMLLETLERLLERKNMRKLVASTLSYTVNYKPFEKVRTFYYHRGFKSLGIQNNYYEDGVDRLILLKNL
jgi:ribosomal protein S18 acetylase RimI-like enzyme